MIVQVLNIWINAYLMAIAPYNTLQKILQELKKVKLYGIS